MKNRSVFFYYLEDSFKNLLNKQINKSTQALIRKAFKKSLIIYTNVHFVQNKHKVK